MAMKGRGHKPLTWPPLKTKHGHQTSTYLKGTSSEPNHHFLMVTMLVFQGVTGMILQVYIWPSQTNCLKILKSQSQSTFKRVPFFAGWPVPKTSKNIICQLPWNMPAWHMDEKNIYILNQF